MYLGVTLVASLAEDVESNRHLVDLRFARYTARTKSGKFYD